MSILTWVLLAVGGSAAFAVGGYLKNKKKGEKFSVWKLLGTCLVGAGAGAAQAIPIAGPVVGGLLIGAGGMALGKKAVTAVATRKLPENKE